MLTCTHGTKASRALSFKSRKSREAATAGSGEGEQAPEPRKGTSSGGLLRSLSFKRAASAEPVALKKTASEGVAKASGGEGGTAAAAASATAGEAAPELRKGTSSGGLLRSLSFKRAAPAELKKPASEGVPKAPAPAPTQEPKKSGVGGLIRAMSFSRQKAEAKAFVQKQKQPPDGAAGEAPEKPSASAPSTAPSGLVRKLSFARKKTEAP